MSNITINNRIYNFKILSDEFIYIREEIRNVTVINVWAISIESACSFIRYECYINHHYNQIMDFMQIRWNAG